MRSSSGVRALSQGTGSYTRSSEAAQLLQSQAMQGLRFSNKCSGDYFISAWCELGPSCHSLKPDSVRRAGSFVSGVTAAVKSSSHSHQAADQLVHRPTLIAWPQYHNLLHALLSTVNSDFFRNIDVSQK